MAKQINIRLSDEEYKLISSLAKDMGLKPATYLRNLIREKIVQEQLEKLLEKCRTGKISLNKAWRASGLTPSRFLEELEKHGVSQELPREVENYTIETALKLARQKVDRSHS